METFLEVSLVLIIHIIYRLYVIWDEKHPYIKIVLGEGKGQKRRIKKTGANIITVYGRWTIAPDSESFYVIEK